VAAIDPHPPSPVPGRGIRLFVATFLGVFLAAGLIGVEAWPLTGWRLYARLRHGDFRAWEVVAVAPDGHEAPVDLGRLPPAYHGLGQLLTGFEDLPAGEREATCAGLVAAARQQYPGAAGVAVDHVLGHVRRGPDDPPRDPTGRIRVQRCAGG